MSSIVLKADLPRFFAALRNKAKVSRKIESDGINRALKNVAFRAAQFTAKTTASQISSELKTGDLLPRLATIACNRKYGKGGWNREQHSEMMKSIVKRRRSGAGALRAGWIPAIQMLGGRYRGAKVRSGTTGAEGYALKALPHKLNGLIANAVQVHNFKGQQFSAADIAIAINALERAIGFVTEDMEGYVTRKITQAWKS